MSSEEIGTLAREGRLEFALDPGAWRRELVDEGLVEIPVEGSVALRAALLPDLPGDPADRLIVATALEGHRLITADAALLAWPGSVSRLDARR